jgi:hypothetical protein
VPSLDTIYNQYFQRQAANQATNPGAQHAA